MFGLIDMLFWFFTALVVAAWIAPPHVSRETTLNLARFIFYTLPALLYVAGLALAFLTPLVSPIDYVDRLGAGYARFAPGLIPVIALVFYWRVDSTKSTVYTPRS